MALRTVKVSDNFYSDIQNFRKTLIDKAGLHPNLSIRETMDIAWNMNKLYRFSISEANNYVKKKEVDIYWGNRGRVAKKKSKKNKMNVLINRKRIYPYNMLQNKRGSSFDVLFLSIMVIVLGFVGLVVTNVWNNLYDDNNVVGNIFNSSENSATIGEGINSAIGLQDFIVPTVLFLGIVIIGVLAYSNPIAAPFLIFGLMFTIIIMYFATVFKHAYIDMVDTSAIFTSMIPNFPITDLVLRNLGMYFLFLYLMIVIIQYTRRESVA
ncbi:hypothetical protein LCGC14_0534450 [marine sediment metagenome]|uniref:Uncharacterized protein n=1 Tax=marine sediment metagenome TaxID=412755 RepID=A0A0F9RZ49_9ZZZZ